MRLVIGETQNDDAYPYSIYLVDDKKTEEENFFRHGNWGFGFAVKNSGETYEKNVSDEKNVSEDRIRCLDTHYHFGDMVAQSKEMQTIFKLAEKIAKYDSTVLINGESGTGKELMARGIHQRGERACMPFIPVNCGGIPDSLLESEFFGYRKGSFTGADRNQKGLFEEANGGTIFLDEVGELPLPLQVKLLRVLQEREIRRIGDSKTKKIDVRVIAATARDLKEEVAKGNFRKDLYYRLNVLPIKLPPLKERAEDIPLLCNFFIEKLIKRLGRNIEAVNPETTSLLCGYSWPGNVRELENVIERAVVMADGALLRAEHFPFERRQNAETANPEGQFDGYSLKAAQKVLEKKLITLALIKTSGNRSKATRLLEISHPSLLRKIKDYDITV